MTRNTAGLLIGVLSGLLAACARQEQAATMSLHHLIPEPPSRVLAPQDLFGHETVFSWTPGRGGRSGQVGSVASKEPWEVVSLGRTAKDIDGIEVNFENLQRQSVRLSWRRAGGASCGDCSAEPAEAPQRLVPESRLVFDLRSNPAWSSEIESISVEFERGKAGSTVRSIRGFRLAAPIEGLGARAGWSGKLDLAHDVRTAWASTAETPIRVRTEISPGSMLRFSIGEPGGARPSCRFRVGYDGENGEHEALFEGEASPGRWIDFRVALGGGPARVGTLSFTSEARPGEECPLGFWAGVAVESPSVARPNVVLIVLDTLRADRLSAYGYRRRTTPRLDSWIERRGTIFENAIAAAPWTKPSHVSLFTGLSALRHGVNFDGTVPDELEMLAEQLRKAGYATAAFTGGGFVHPWWGFAQGFDRYGYHSLRSFGEDEELRENVALASAWLAANRDTQSFLFLHTYEMHNPYVARAPYAAQFGRPEEGRRVTVERVLGDAANGFRDGRRLVGDASTERWDAGDLISLASDLYDSQLAYLDEVLSPLLEQLEEDSERSRTIVVITSDHGEMFGEHGLVDHLSLYDENLLVPLLVAPPAGEERTVRRVSQQVRSIDVLPTILELVGLEAGEGVEGLSLGDLMRGRADSRERPAWSYAGTSNFGLSLRRRNAEKLIFVDSIWPSPAPRFERYDLRRDSRELENLADAGRATAEFGELLRERQSGAEGVVVTLEAGAFAMETRIHLPGLRNYLVKAVDWPPGEVRRVPNGLAVALEPGERARFVLCGVETGKLKLEIASGAVAGRQSQTEDFALPLATPIVRFVERPGGALRRSSNAKGAARIELLWRPGRVSKQSPDAPGEPDRELQDSLRALGYLN